MEINYSCTYWGLEHLDAAAFIDKTFASGYNGIEIYLPPTIDFVDNFLNRLEDAQSKNSSFTFIPQCILFPENETVSAFIKRVEEDLLKLVSYQPTFINAHTGKDHFSFDDNCRIIEACQNISDKTGIKILHETHRGRFSFHGATLLPYLEKFPELELVADFSHFCVVSESLLKDQESIMAKIIPHVSHIHARIGFDQGPQVNDPFAPEWKNHLTVFQTWWQKIIENKQQQGWNTFTITPEFGPEPYMPALPFTKQPIGNQWEINKAMMAYLKTNL